MKLPSYTGQCIQVLGTSEFSVRYLDKSVRVPIHVVKGGGPNLLGRDLLTQFHFNLSYLNVLEGCSQPLKPILDKHPDIFSNQVGCLRDVAVTLPMHSDAKQILQA